MAFVRIFQYVLRCKIIFALLALAVFNTAAAYEVPGNPKDPSPPQPNMRNVLIPWYEEGFVYPVVEVPDGTSTCAQENKVRLRGGAYQMGTIGALQVCARVGNQLYWGNVCLDNFTIADGYAACRTRSASQPYVAVGNWDDEQFQENNRNRGRSNGLMFYHNQDCSNERSSLAKEVLDDCPRVNSRGPRFYGIDSCATGGVGLHCSGDTMTRDFVRLRCGPYGAATVSNSRRDIL